MKKLLNFHRAQIELLILALVLAASCAEAASVNRTWNGSTDGYWGTAANWTPNGSPVASNPYDSVIFGGTTRLVTTNNLTTSISNLTFTAGGFSVNGNSLIIRSGITNSAGVNTVNLPVTFANNPKNWDVAAGAEIDFIGGSGTATFTGSPPFEKFDAGNVRFQGTNLWSQGADLAGGALILDGGSLSVTNDGFRLVAANNAWAGLIITNGGTLTLGANSIGKSLNLKLGSTQLLTGTNELDLSSGQIFLGANLTQFIVGDQTGTYGVVNQNGGAILYQNNNAGNDLLLGNSAGTTGIYNLNGGLLQVPLIIGGSKGGASYFNFNGGTLTPYTAANANNFIQGLTAATIKNGGAIIDTTNINLTITQPLLNGGTGGLTKLGVGTLTLSGANTYAGTSIVSAGELIVPTIQTGGGAFQVADNAALGLTVAATGTSLNTASLILGSNTGATNEFFLGAAGNPTSPVIIATNLTVNGFITVNIYGAGFSIGQFPLIKYVSTTGLTAGSFQLGLLPAGVGASIVNDTANHSIDLEIVSAPNIVWTGGVNNVWDIGSTANWFDLVGQQGVEYSDGTAVQFDDTATGSTAINIATTVSPGGVTIANNVLNYSFSGAGISGSGAFTKSGSGTVVVGTQNTYTGNTVINGGLLQLGTSQAIPGGAGEGNVVVNGELDLAGNTQTINALNGNGEITSSTGAGTLTLGANNASGTFTGVIADSSGTVALVKSGTGAQILTATNNFSGGVTLAGGTLQVGGASLGSGPLYLQIPVTGTTLASYAGSLNLTNPVYLFGGADYPAYFDTTGGDIILNNTLTGTGPDIFKKGYNSLRIGAAGGGYSAGGVLQLYQGAFVVDGGAWTNVSNGIRFYAGGNDTVRLVVTNGGTFVAGFGGTGTYNIQLGYAGGLTGTNELDISSGQVIFGPPFRQIIAGNVAGTYGVVNQTGGTISFQGVTNASVGVLLGNNTGTVGSYYLNGGNLITPRVIGGSGSGYLYLNGGTLTPASTFSTAQFVSGLTAAYVGNGGAIFDTTNISVTVSESLLSGGSGGLTKLGVSTLTLTGTNTYTGPTLVNAGELWLPTTQLGGGSISVADGAALGIALSASNLISNPTLNASTLTLGNVTGSTLEFNLGTAGNPVAPLAYATNLVVSGNIPVNISGSQLTLGQFPLLQYGAASGLTPASFQLNNAVLAPGLAAYVSNNVAHASIDLVVTVAPTLAWTGNAGSAWDIASTVNWLNLGTLQPSVYTDGAFVRLDDSATGSTTVTLNTLVAPAGIWVSNNVQTYTLNGSYGIGGTATFTKDGSGTVIVGTANTYTSNTVINAGTLQLGVNQAIPGGNNAGNVTVNGTLDLAGNSEVINGLSGGGTIDNSTGNGVLTVGSNNAAGIFTGAIGNSGGSLALVKLGTNSLALTANNTFTGGTTLSGGTLQIGGPNALGAGALAFNVPAVGTTMATYNGSLTVTNAVSIGAVGGGEYPANFDTTAGDLVLSGPVNATAADFAKLGSNTLHVASSASSILNAGKILLYQGDLLFDGTTWTNYGGAIRTFAASGAIVHLAITNGTTLSVGTVGSTPNLRLGYNAGLAGTNELDISSGELILDVTFAQILVGDATSTFGIVNQTGGTVLFQNNTNTSTAVTLGNSAGSTGWYYLNGGTLITPRVNGGSGTGYFYFNGGTLTPSSTLSASNFVSGFTAAYVGNGGAVIDTTNISVVVSQPLLNGGTGGLTKLGSATLTLSGTNSYAGPTLVSNGTLMVSGSLDTNAVIVSGSALAGNGVINGAVTINTNGALILGSTDPVNTSTLTISNNLNIAGAVFAKLNKSLTQSNDAAIVTGTLSVTGTGTLTLTNVGPALAAGDTFPLFNQPVANGNRVVIASSPGAGLAWQNHLAVNGTVAVVAAPNQPVITQFSVIGNSLSFQGSYGQAHGQYVLYASTNLALPLANWTPVLTNVFDGNGNFGVTTNLTTAGSQQFFILKQ